MVVILNHSINKLVDMKYCFYTCLILVFISTKGYTNTDFISQLKHEDPDSVNINSSFEEIKKLHHIYLNKAVQSDDTLRQIFGLIYLYNDHVEKIDYEQAGEYIIQAELLAQTSNNNNWLGWINHKKGALNVHLRDFPLAIKYYRKSLQFCKESSDSLGLALNYEQLCSMHSQLNNYDSAHYYFSLAEPLLESYADKNALSVAFINYGSLLVYQNQCEEAIPYFKKASDLCNELKDSYRKVQCDQNLAVAYINIGEYDTAAALYADLIKINKENKWPERLFYNYYGLYQMHALMENHEEALNYYVKFHKLKDSVLHEQTKIQISDFESKIKLDRQTSLFDESQLNLQKTKLTFQRSILIFSIVILLALVFLYVLFTRAKQTKNTLKLRQDKLKSLTRLLIQKNKKLAEMDKELTVFRKTEESIAISQKNENNLYNNRILTDSDWLAFKVSFEESYPGYIQKLNNNHRNLSEGERRLFLFIKLGLKTKETSLILGISLDSVKKSRYRLRKRLELDETESLEDYVNFLDSKKEVQI